MNIENRRRPFLGRALSLLLLILLASPFPVLSAQSPAPTTNAATPSPPYTNYGLSLLDGGDRITLGSLVALTNDQLSVAAFDRVIQADLLQYNVRQVLLDVGWQNFTVDHVQFEPWVADWLTACDELGVTNVLYMGPLTQAGIGSPWVQSVIKTDPSARTAFANGTLADYVSPDNPDVAKFIEVDLKTMYGYYGNYSSWIGLGTGYPENTPYYSQSTTVPTLGYSNSSVQQFANSPYYSSGTTPIGPGAGVANALASAYLSAEPSISVASGVWMTSSAYQIYGSSASSHEVEMRFYVPANESGLLIEWYGSKYGGPSALNATIYPDNNASISLKPILANASQAAGLVTNRTGWQAPLVVHGDFRTGYYWILFSSPNSDSSNFYSIYTRDYFVGNASATVLLPPGQGSLRVSSILWVKGSGGQNLTIYPYEEENIPGTIQDFTATGSHSFNTVLLFLSDRDYDPTNGTITITDLSENGTVVATGTLSQQLIQGIQNWTPIPLDRNVTTIKGHEYSMAVTENDAGYSWAVVLRGLTADPVSAGFQNQTSYWLFQLGYVKWGSSETNYGVITTNGKDSVTQNVLDALRFIPSTDETLNSIQVLMKNTGDSAPYYTAGNLTVGIWRGDVNGTRPLSPIKSITVPASSVPTNAWLNVSGFAQPVSRGQYYWLVLSTSSNSTFPLARLTSAYSALVLTSFDGGRSWQAPAEGPTDLSYGIFLSGQTLGNFVQDIPTIEIGQSTEFAQPFTSPAQEQVKGIYLGVLSTRTEFAPDSGFVVSIRPDNGSGSPSQLILASGTISAANVTYYSNEYVAFSSVARLQAGQTYWIVVQARDGLFYVNPVVYQTSPPGTTKNDSALISTDSGFTWGKVSNSTTILSYKIALPETPAPTYSTTVLSRELTQYYDLALTGLPLLGWNAYVRSSELSTLTSIATWFDGSTGRQWTVSTAAYPIVAEQVRAQDVDLLPLTQDLTTCSQLQQYFQDIVPKMGAQDVETGSLSLLESCGSTNVKSLALEMSRMYYLPIASNSTASRVDVGLGSPLVYGVWGTAGGPLLIWLSNPTTGALSASVSVNESASTRQWDIIDVSNLNTQEQNASIVQTQVSVPPGGWLPLYIEPARGELTTSYYTASLLREFTYPNQGVYDTSGMINQSVIVAVDSSTPIKSVSVNDGTNLTRLSSPIQVLNASEGWYFDNSSNMLLVTYTSHGADSIRVLRSTPIDNPAVLPARTIEDVLVVLLVVEASIGLYLAVTRQGKKNKKGPPPGEKSDRAPSSPAQN